MLAHGSASLPGGDTAFVTVLVLRACTFVGARVCAPRSKRWARAAVRLVSPVLVSAAAGRELLTALRVLPFTRG